VTGGAFERQRQPHPGRGITGGPYEHLDTAPAST